MTPEERSALRLALEKLRRAEGYATKREDWGGVITYLLDARLRLAKVLGIDEDALPPTR